MIGLKPIPILIATLGFWFIGFLWYGVVFMKPWMDAHGLPPDDAGGFDIYMGLGVFTTLMQVIGIGLVLKWRGVASIGGALKTIALLWLTIALPGIASAFIYLPAHNATLLAIDAGYVLVGWLITAFVYALLR